MNHKRGRPKNRRAGCLMCKWWKVNGANHKSTGQDHKNEERARQERQEAHL